MDRQRAGSWRTGRDEHGCARRRDHPSCDWERGARGGSQWKGVRRLTMETTRAESHVDVHVDVGRSAMGGGQRRRQQPAARGATMRACESRGQSWGVAWRQSRASMRRVGRRKRRDEGTRDACDRRQWWRRQARGQTRQLFGGTAWTRCGRRSRVAGHALRTNHGAGQCDPNVASALDGGGWGEP